LITVFLHELTHAIQKPHLRHGFREWVYIRIWDKFQFFVSYAIILHFKLSALVVLNVIILIIRQTVF